MSDSGYLFGAHGKTHNLLTKFEGASLIDEVRGSIKELNYVLDERSNTFCFPYGGLDSYNEKILQELSDSGIEFSFCVESKDIESEDIKNRPLSLPRYDCNEFPHGRSRNLR
jgi:peptidoglycan/xylan/chitin deacetylase (PgdA/CDA1 family)